jgi:hypothetical protein
LRVFVRRSHGRSTINPADLKDALRSTEPQHFRPSPTQSGSAELLRAQ